MPAEIVNNVTIHGEDFKGRTGRFAKNLDREYTRIFLCTAAYPHMDARDVANALAFSSYQIARGTAVMPGDDEAHCTDIDPVNSGDDPYFWTVTVKYSTAIDEYVVDPAQKPTIYTWSTEFVEKGEAADLDGEIIQNSANETFEPPPSSLATIDVIKASCTRETFDRETDKDQYIQHVNSGLFTIDGQEYGPGQVVLWDLEVGMVEEGGRYWRKFDYTFKARRDLYTTTSTTLTNNEAIGNNVVVELGSVAGIVVGDEVYIDEDEDRELVYVEAVGAGSITVDLTVAHLAGAAVEVRKYHPWQYQPLDAGYMEWTNANGGKFIDVVTSGGQPVQHPVLLNGDGERIDTASEPPDDPVRLFFRLRDNANLQAIVFP